MNNLAHLLLIPLKKIIEKENMRANNFIRQSVNSKPQRTIKWTGNYIYEVFRFKIDNGLQTNFEWKGLGSLKFKYFWGPEGTDVITPLSRALKRALNK